ncbi:mechanosensitive ion channel [Stieleria sp. JC731]|uniref:mechanosensitive ion channel family protein n=1 Tax=Pirellulaceae TaxID=2691357 RepID=UPI001E2F5573|nr:mechanosensitive ion channel family protein [Stieleria sp. JC731]MCC9600298.1 mechanosensitive ion channel [Stieleria sp. JC731]
MIRLATLLFLAAATSFTAFAQDESPTAEDVAAEVTGGEAADRVDVADKVEVDPVNSDERIEKRLQEIMEATGWFDSPSVDVDRGVAFLKGTADSKKHQAWAEATAMNTADVVAVVNRVGVAEQPLWNLAPAVASLKQLGRETTGILPLILIALVIGILSYYVALVSAKLTRWITQNRIDSRLLRQVAGNVVAVIIFIIGMYIALRVSGLTRLAVTLLGGTGLVGLALGFAFRDIAENYLASILISLNHPFRVGDLIEVEGAMGYVRKVTTRGTVLNTLEGNQIQLPNSTVYKGKITNYTATPLSRRDFKVGIGFDDSIVEAQEIIMGVLVAHETVVDDPAPLVIVDSLGSATVNLHVLYWFDQTKHSALKVSSSVIRQVKQQLTEAKITMPDEARELVFPQGVPVQMLEGEIHSPPPEKPKSNEPEPTVSSGEGNLATEQGEVMRATENDATIDDEANLIA